MHETKTSRRNLAKKSERLRKSKISRRKTVFEKNTIKIGQLSKLTRVPEVTLRFYEIEKTHLSSQESRPRNSAPEIRPIGGGRGGVHQALQIGWVFASGNSIDVEAISWVQTAGKAFDEVRLSDNRKYSRQG